MISARSRLNSTAQTLAIAGTKLKDVFAMTSRAAFHQGRITANPLASAPAGSFLSIGYRYPKETAPAQFGVEGPGPV
jgi:hypothetical protein